jgi:hypothetical protein
MLITCTNCGKAEVNEGEFEQDDLGDYYCQDCGIPEFDEFCEDDEFFDDDETAIPEEKSEK